jgi:hypothetical protein
MVLDDVDGTNSNVRRIYVEHRAYRSETQGEVANWWPLPVALADRAVSDLTKRVLAFVSRNSP